jgi:hypothetical protein
MPKLKSTKAKKFRLDEMKIELVAAVDSSLDAELKAEMVQDIIAKMILLGLKKGRPKTEEEEIFYEKAA